LTRTRSLEDFQPRSIAWEVSAVVGLCAAEDPAVIGFLLEHGQLPALVLEACWRLGRLIGRGPVARLRLTHNPEEGTEDLFLVVQVDGDMDVAYAALDRFDRDWFLSIPPELKEQFGVTLG